MAKLLACASAEEVRQDVRVPAAARRTRRPTNWLGDSPLERFLAQIPGDRVLILVLLVFVLGGSIWADLASDWWNSMPIVSNLATSLLLLAFTLLLLDEYLKWRAAEAWKSVAAFALEDLATVARAVWVRQASVLAPAMNTITVDEYRRLLGHPSGREEVADGAQRAVVYGLRWDLLFDTSRETARRTRDLIIAWSPSLIPHGRLAPYLAEIATLHRRLVQILRVMSFMRKNMTPPVSTEQLCRWHAEVIYLAIALDERLYAEAAEIDHLLDYAFASDYS